MDGTTTARAVAALGAADAALDRARAALTGAREFEWVSDAADGYRHLLADLERDVAHLGLQLAQAQAGVLRHTRSADVACAVHRAAGAAGMAGGGPGPSAAIGWRPA
ncbi:hypothetical protein [Actinotalea sp.]|uniref:hypothetical protein n=1 Tax=Actinotalea sp. TaxID=1872145 RepID=UPI002C57027A|nr:hypothetical protein [Actinotalea sp.]HQY32905.1 hypothetical protein [Actinotalea sp.]HRA49861.1 hypothetical protein [Actinotalea sp.]